MYWLKLVTPQAHREWDVFTKLYETKFNDRTYFLFKFQENILQKKKASQWIHHKTVLFRLLNQQQGFALAVPGCPWHQTIFPVRLEYLSFKTETLRWTPWRATVHEWVPFNFSLSTAFFIYSIFTAKKKKNLATLHKRTINHILEEKKDYCSGEGLEGNIRTIRASPPKNYNRHLNKEKEKRKH